MDDRKLETRRIAALQHVQRCTPTCPSSTSCRFRRARSKLREGGKPCTREILPHTRFVLEVERVYGCSTFAAAFDLLQAANDAALIELLLDSGTWCQAGSSAFAEEASKALRPGPGKRGLTQAKLPKGAETCLSPVSMAKNRSRSLGPSSMRLTERKRILIDIRRALHHGATVASPPAHLSLINSAFETAKEDLYDTV